MWHFPKVFVKVLCDEGEFDLKLSYRVFRIAQAIASDVELRSEVQTIFFDTHLWKNVLLGKVYGFQRCRTDVYLFSNIVNGLAQSYINCLVESENAKSSFSMGICERTTCTENNSPCRATEAGLFSNVAFVYGHQVFSQIRTNKTFFEMNLGKKF